MSTNYAIFTNEVKDCVDNILTALGLRGITDYNELKKNSNYEDVLISQATSLASRQFYDEQNNQVTLTTTSAIQAITVYMLSKYKDKTGHTVNINRPDGSVQEIVVMAKGSEYTDVAGNLDSFANINMAYIFDSLGGVTDTFLEETFTTIHVLPDSGGAAVHDVAMNITFNKSRTELDTSGIDSQLYIDLADGNLLTALFMDTVRIYVTETNKSYLDVALKKADDKIAGKDTAPILANKEPNLTTLANSMNILLNVEGRHDAFAIIDRNIRVQEVNYDIVDPNDSNKKSIMNFNVLSSPGNHAPGTAFGATTAVAAAVTPIFIFTNKDNDFTTGKPAEALSWIPDGYTIKITPTISLSGDLRLGKFNISQINYDVKYTDSDGKKIPATDAVKAFASSMTLRSWIPDYKIVDDTYRENGPQIDFSGKTQHIGLGIKSPISVRELLQSFNDPSFNRSVTLAEKIKFSNQFANLVEEEYFRTKLLTLAYTIKDGILANKKSSELSLTDITTSTFGTDRNYYTYSNFDVVSSAKSFSSDTRYDAVMSSVSNNIKTAIISLVIDSYFEKRLKEINQQYVPIVKIATSSKIQRYLDPVIQKLNNEYAGKIIIKINGTMDSRFTDLLILTMSSTMPTRGGDVLGEAAVNPFAGLIRLKSPSIIGSVARSSGTGGTYHLANIYPRYGGFNITPVAGVIEMTGLEEALRDSDAPSIRIIN